jgi:hypothetical protein
MDTNTFELEQGVAVPTDLLQQEPHAEVLAVSLPLPSDEERLAAGVSTTRLQTKKLSGATEKAHQRQEDEGSNLDG